MIALPCPLHEVSLHVRLVCARPVWSRLESIGCSADRIVPESLAGGYKSSSSRWTGDRSATGSPSHWVAGVAQ
jgi:hypothetical protein